jgi:hypothetical protein
MLVKSGDCQTAQKIYANARLSKTYAEWKYQAALDDRIGNAQANVAVFNAAPGISPTPMMIDSDFACMACHRD